MESEGRCEIVLKQDGRLVFTRVSSPGTIWVVDAKPFENFDGYLVLYSFPYATQVKVPVRAGFIQVDRSQWETIAGHDEAQVAGVVPGGFTAHVGDDYSAFLPNSVLPQDLQGNASLEMKIFKFEVIHSESPHRHIIRPIGPFRTFDDTLRELGRVYTFKDGSTRPAKVDDR